MSKTNTVTLDGSDVTFADLLRLVRSPKAETIQITVLSNDGFFTFTPGKGVETLRLALESLGALKDCSQEWRTAIEKQDE